MGKVGSCTPGVSFADDTRLYSGVGDVTDCDNLQIDLNAVYNWTSSNNMFFNSKKLSYVCFSSKLSAYKTNLYIDPAMNIIGTSTHVLDLGVSMSLIFINDAQTLLAGFSEHLL